jgi:hypothetical protein
MERALPWREAVVGLLDLTRLAQPEELPSAVNQAVARLGLHMTIYLVDQEQRGLRPLPEPGKPVPEPLPIDGTVAGRAFMTIQGVPAPGGPGQPDRLWLALVDGTERLGVIEVVVAQPRLVDTPEFQAECLTVAALIGHLITVKMPYGDELVRVRRTRRMSEASELLWRLLPPLTFACERMVVSAVLEPCYDIGGDGFDYAVNGPLAYLTILDTVGHGLLAGLGTAVALSAMRAARHDGDDLTAVARAADAALLEYIGDARFATAVLCELNLDTGLLRYINAGHPPPLLLRQGKVVRQLDQGRRLPLGLDDPEVDVADEVLEPGDRLLLYTDGITEARDRSGEPFGEQRLVDLAERQAAAELPAPETLRRLCHAALDHYDGPPADDATLLLLEWSHQAAERAVP